MYHHTRKTLVVIILGLFVWGYKNPDVFLQIQERYQWTAKYEVGRRLELNSSPGP